MKTQLREVPIENLVQGKIRKNKNQERMAAAKIADLYAKAKAKKK